MHHVHIYLVWSLENLEKSYPILFWTLLPHPQNGRWGGTAPASIYDEAFLVTPQVGRGTHTINPNQPRLSIFANITKH